MRTWLACLSVMVIIGLIGCGGKKEDETGDIKTNAPINNSAPEAKTAPGAPSDPSIIYPGAKKKGGSASPGVPPPTGPAGGGN